MNLHKKLLLILISILVFAGILLWWRAENHSLQDQSQNQSEMSGNNTENVEDSTLPTAKRPVDTNESQNNSELKPEIVSIDQSENKIIARGFMPSLTDGTCLIEFTKENLVVKQSRDSISQPSYMQCEVFELNTNELSETGYWDVYLYYFTDSEQYKSNLWEFEVE